MMLLCGNATDWQLQSNQLRTLKFCTHVDNLSYCAVKVTIAVVLMAMLLSQQLHPYPLTTGQMHLPLQLHVGAWKMWDFWHQNTVLPAPLAVNHGHMACNHQVWYSNGPLCYCSNKIIFLLLLLLHLFNGHLSGTNRDSWYQKGKINLDLLEQKTVSGIGISWVICKSAPRPRHNHASIPPSVFTGWSPSCHPTNSIKALKASFLLN